ncbi:hypothetical protein VTK26DRAFT_3780 [Humicola hyalothermophila]
MIRLPLFPGPFLSLLLPPGDLTPLVKRQYLLGREPEDIPPWGLYFANRTWGALIWGPRQAPDATVIIRALRGSFCTIDAWWNVAGL